MTSTEADRILQSPVFGNQVCIDAISVMLMSEELSQARDWAKAKGVSAPRKRTGSIASMQHEAIEDELAYWRQCGYRN
jgi:hypothetical protein